MPEKIGMNDISHQQRGRGQGVLQLEECCKTDMVEPCASLLERYLEESGPGRVYDPRYFVDQNCQLVRRSFESHVEAHREVRHLECELHLLRNKRDRQAKEVSATLNSTAKSSRQISDPKGLALWANGAIERNYWDLYIQGEEARCWLVRPKQKFGTSRLKGFSFDPAVLAESIAEPNDRLGATLREIIATEEALWMARKLRDETGAAFDRDYFYTKQLCESICHLSGHADVAKHCLPPSLRKLLRLKKRKSKLARKAAKHDARVKKREEEQTAVPLLTAQEATAPTTTELAPSRTESEALATESAEAGTEGEAAVVVALEAGTEGEATLPSPVEAGTEGHLTLDHGPETGIQGDFELQNDATDASEEEPAAPEPLHGDPRSEKAPAVGSAAPSGRSRASAKSPRPSRGSFVSLTKGSCRSRRGLLAGAETSRSQESRGNGRKRGVTARILQFLTGSGAGKVGSGVSPR